MCCSFKMVMVKSLFRKCKKIYRLRAVAQNLRFKNLNAPLSRNFGQALTKLQISRIKKAREDSASFCEYYE